MKKVWKMRAVWGSLLLLLPILPAAASRPLYAAEKEQQKFALPQIICPQPDGNNGYYITPPKIRIIHKDIKATVKYMFCPAEGETLTGELKPGQDTCILAEAFAEGRNLLECWTEYKEDGVYKRTNYQKKDILVDTIPPSAVTFLYARTSGEGKIFSSLPYTLGLTSSDTVSGVAYIYYKLREEEGGTLPGSAGQLLLKPDFWGRVEAYAVDNAGNKSVWSSSEEILCEDDAPEIFIDTDGGETWTRDPVGVHVTVQEAMPGAGIRKMLCYSAGVQVLQKTAVGEEATTVMEADFTVTEPQEGEEGTEVAVEVWDNAGNFRRESRNIYLDRVSPVIRFAGVRDSMVSREPVSVTVSTKEEHVLACRELEVWRSTPEGDTEAQRILREDASAISAIKEKNWKIMLEQDGIYEIKASAQDQAGNRTVESRRVIVDRTAPVIAYIEQMQDACVPYFQWNYTPEEVIQDFTAYTFEFLLDGKPYREGERSGQEGRRYFQISATDAAGNVSSAAAEFYVDSTPPRIGISGAEKGKICRVGTAADIFVDGSGERLKEVRVNSVRMDLAEDAQIFHYVFGAEGEYKMEIVAEDLAGNQSREEYIVQVEKQELPAGELLENVGKILNGQKQKEKKAGAEDTKRKWKNLAVSAGFVLLLFSCLGILLRRVRLRIKK